MDEVHKPQMGRPTMSVREAAQRAGVHEETVRRWIDAQDRAGHPVAERERDLVTRRPIPGRRRRPYVDAIEQWIAARAGEPGGQDVGGGPADV